MKKVIFVVLFATSLAHAESVTIKCNFAHVDLKSGKLIESSKSIVSDGTYQESTVLVDNQMMKVKYNAGGTGKFGSADAGWESSISVRYSNGLSMQSTSTIVGYSPLSLMSGKIGSRFDFISVTCTK